MCWEKGHGNAGARQAGRRQGDDDGQAADDLHHMTAPGSVSRRVSQLLAALPRGIDRKEPRPTPKAHNRALRTRRGRGGRFQAVSAMSASAPTATAHGYSKTAAACHKCHPEAEEWASFVPEAMPTMRA
jgi:hypothetical protein